MKNIVFVLIMTLSVILFCSIFSNIANEKESLNNKIKTDLNFKVVDTIINNIKFNINYSYLKRNLYVNLDDKIFDTCSFFIQDNTELRKYKFLVDNKIYTNIIFDKNYIILCLPLLHINTYTTLSFKVDFKKKTIAYCDNIDFSDRFNYDSKSKVIKCKYFNDKFGEEKDLLDMKFNLNTLCN